MKALIVEDSKVVRLVLSQILKEIGFEVDHAEDGEKALQILSNSKPDLVMIDWYMPVMNGFELLQKIKQSGMSPMPKVVFCTAETNSSNIEMVIKNGADEYIMKPFDRDIVRSKLEQLGLIKAA